MVEIKSLTGYVLLTLDASDLTRADLAGAYLAGAYLAGADLTRADLTRADLAGANLTRANLAGAYLAGAYLAGANLTGADLAGADLTGAYLTRADLAGANLTGANLTGANLAGANLTGANLPHYMICPEQGSFFAHKCIAGALITLEIPAEARRTSSLVGRKCRAEYALVIRIERDGSELDAVTGGHAGLTYRVGETIYPDSYDDDIRIECTHGIHFFVTRREAADYR